MSLLSLKDIRKSFDQPVVAGSLEVEKGEHVALVGESGIGKSTLLHLISGVLRPDSGTIELLDSELTALPETSLDLFRAKNIGYIFQTFHLLDGLTALENVEAAVTFAGADYYERAKELLEGMGLGDRLHYLPSKLSVGQRQRVAVARAVVNEPPLVLADEPTANLDSVRAKEVMKLLQETCRRVGSALMLVTHDQSVLEDFDRVIDYKEQFQVNL